jgi:hypothetical protein
MSPWSTWEAFWCGVALVGFGISIFGLHLYRINSTERRATMNVHEFHMGLYRHVWHALKSRVRKLFNLPKE